MAFIPDPLSKTVKIPVEIKKNNVEFYFEGPLPEIMDGTLGDLVVPLYAVKDTKFKNLLSEERKIPLLKKGTDLFVQIHFDVNDGNLEIIEADPNECGVKVKMKFARIILEENLFLYLRGTKHPILSSSKCKSVLINNVRGDSLNHIYTLLSELYEKDRISHTGNVFKKIFFWDRVSKCLLPIERFRRMREILFEDRFYNDGT